MAHDIYTHWQTKDGGSCCHDKDCTPAITRETDGKLQAKIDGVWYDVPKDAIRPYEAPDGQSHVCFFAGKVQCFVYGTGI